MDTDRKLRWGSPRSHLGGRDALVNQVAAELGCSRAKAASLMWGTSSAAAIAARIIRALKRAGADETLLRFAQPIDEAMQAAAPAALTGDLFIVEQEADGAEDAAEVAYLAQPNPDTAQSFIRRAQRAAAALNHLVRSVRTRWNLA